MTGPTPEEEQLTRPQLVGLIKWVQELADSGHDLQGVIDRLHEWNAEMGLPEGLHVGSIHIPPS